MCRCNISCHTGRSKVKPGYPSGSARPALPKPLLLLAGINEVFPLACLTYQALLTFIPFLITEPGPITQILARFGEPSSLPLIYPARGPPQIGLAMGPGGGEGEEAAQDYFPDGLDQSPEFNPVHPVPIPVDDFDQKWGA